ncbi:hypothetical protein pipiens_012757 [Culex pipiens pipiens]|uniref:Uncharacterized protein n=2 Tax=Culex pipiens pipiens TaxID=38569 RepID=A0ABD1D137_CULPP
MLRHERQPELRVGAEVLNDTKAASVILMCEAIGDCPGQVSPDLHKVCDYNSNKVKDLQEVLFEMHFDERSRIELPENKREVCPQIRGPREFYGLTAYGDNRMLVNAMQSR